MSLTRETIANVRYRLEELADAIDHDPSLAAVVISVRVNPRNKHVVSVHVSTERKFEAASPGVTLAEESLLNSA